jgi:two-component system chemotaxis response regulator CheB
LPLNRRGRDVIVVGASAGGVEALRTLVRGLPAELPAAVFIVLHISPEGGSVLPELLSRAGVLEAGRPESDGGVPFERGRIYVAPPDRHMVIDGDRVRVVRSARENRHRPAVDPLFRSAALHHGPHVVGVILTGSLDDGTAGLAAVKRRGGVAVVQDPDEAMFSSMPRSAMQRVAVDHCVPLADIPALLARLASEDPARHPAEVASGLALETRLTTVRRPEAEDADRIGRASMFTCPECHGALWEIDDDSVLRYRCHVGHALTAESLAADQTLSLEATLWAAVRAFEERAHLSERMAERARADGRPERVVLYGERADLARVHADQVRGLLAPAPGGDPPEAAETTAAGPRRGRGHRAAGD